METSVNVNLSGRDIQERYKITVIGLGLIGGSMAMALRGFKNAVITGVDVDSEALRKALACGAVDIASDDTTSGIADADLVILCVAPHHIMQIIRENAGSFKIGSIITDVCGTKRMLYDKIEAYIPDGVDYIGIHPMAGKEVGGFDNACPELFSGTGFIIVPLNRTEHRSVSLMEELSAFIGAVNIARNSPEIWNESVLRNGPANRFEFLLDIGDSEVSPRVFSSI